MTRREFAQLVATAVDGVAREEAARRGFDIDKESHGLMRAILTVMTNKELFVEALRRAREQAKA